MKTWVKQVMAFSVVSLLMCALVSVIVPMQAKGSGDFLDGQTIYLSMLGDEAASGSNAKYQPASGSDAESGAAVLTITGAGVTLAGEVSDDLPNLKVVVKAASGSNADLTLDSASWSNNVDELLVFHSDAKLTVKGESILTQDFSWNLHDTTICKADGKLEIVGESTDEHEFPMLYMDSKSYYKDSNNNVKIPKNGVLDVEGALDLKYMELHLFRDTQLSSAYYYSNPILGQCSSLDMVESVLNTPGTVKIKGSQANSMDNKSLILLGTSGLEYQDYTSGHQLKADTRECLVWSTEVGFYGRTIETQNPTSYITPVATDSNAEIVDFVTGRDEGVKATLNLGYIKTLERDVSLPEYWSYDYEKDELTLFKDDMGITGTVERKQPSDGSAGRAFHIIAKDAVENIYMSVSILNKNAMEAPAISFQADKVMLNASYLHLETTGAGIEAKDLDLYGDIDIDSKGDGIKANNVVIESQSSIDGAIAGNKESNNNLNLTGDLTITSSRIQVNSQNKNVPALKAKTVTIKDATALGAYNSREGKDFEINGLDVDESLLVSYTGSGIDNLEQQFVKIPEGASEEDIYYNEARYMRRLFSARVNEDGTVNPNGKYYLHNTKYAIVDEFNLFGTGKKNVYTVTLNAVNGNFKKADGTLTDKVELIVTSEKGFRHSQEFELVPDEGYEIGNYKEYRNILSWYYGPNRPYDDPMNYVCVAMDWYYGTYSSWDYETDYMTIADLETKELDVVFPKIGHVKRTVEFAIDSALAEFTAPEEAVGKTAYHQDLEPGETAKTVKIKVKKGFKLWGWQISTKDWKDFDHLTEYDAEAEEYSITMTLRSDISSTNRTYIITPYITEKAEDNPSVDPSDPGPSHTSHTSNASSNASGIWKRSEDGKDWIYTDYKGNPLTGWQNYKNCWYLMDDNGRMQTGWRQVNGKWYFLHDSGMMATGWLFTGGSWYYLNKNGDMQTGWICLGEKWYYLNENGVMESNKLTPDGYYVDENGVWNYKAPEQN